MGRISKRLLGAAGGIAGGELARTAIAKRAFKLGLGNAKLLKSAGRKAGEKAAEYIPYARGGVVVIVQNGKKAPRKRRARK